ncbi:MAG: hypothetical protein M5U12_15775 [Verrucomicrobia bacterium]|nr:hypothetical protein [Verrucomicrobiota bacterium]
MLELGLASARPWRPEELAAAWEYHLSAPPRFDLSRLDAAQVDEVRELLAEQGLLLASLRGLLRHPVPPVELLELTRDFAKTSLAAADPPATGRRERPVPSRHRGGPDPRRRAHHHGERCGLAARLGLVAGPSVGRRKQQGHAGSGPPGGRRHCQQPLNTEGVARRRRRRQEALQCGDKAPLPPDVGAYSAANAS